MANIPSTSHKQKITTKEMALCGMFTVLIAVGAFVKIPTPLCPITLQVLFTTMAGLLLGSRLGGLSVAIYMALGLIGLPIFTEGGGLWYVIKPTFGYIIGFMVGAFVTGYIVERLPKLSFVKILVASLIGLLIIYVMGLFYYYLICNFVISTPVAFWPLVVSCFLLPLPGDICSCIVAGLLLKKLKPALWKAGLLQNTFGTKA